MKETIVWFDYPDVKPQDESRVYLVKTTYALDTSISKGFISKGRWYDEYN